ncbi:dATP pyrophosphohydrolase [Dongia sp.]|uniref:dATP pyrophosphohydrolase n=1 Tax=Dongia sp. TaxID=1977262 RepID=UPI0035B085AF
MAKIEVVPVTDAAGLKAFIALPKRLYQGQKGYVAPLDMEREEVLSPKKNPYFTHAKAQLFIARRDGTTVGRISAQVCSLEQKLRPGTGHFGWLDAEDDPAIYRALIDTVADWLRKEGSTRIVGPLSFCTNEETGLLVDGFDSLPMLMMPYHAPYAGKNVEAAGLAKLKDLVAYDLDKSAYKPMGSSRMLEKMQVDGTIRMRGLDMKNYTRDLGIILDIFNDAWSENWGMIPFTADEIAAAAKSMKPLIDPDLVVIAEVKGEPAGMLVCLPNLMEAIRDFNGSLLPFNVFKLLWRLKRKTLKSSRIPLMGIRKQHHGSVLGATLLPLMFNRLKEPFLKRGLESVEMSWILEDNLPMRRVIEGVGGKVYKTYRIYEKSLA